MNPSQLINQSSGNVEIYTPSEIIEAARTAMGGKIELDPASCESANNIVKAVRYFSESENGLSKAWDCRTLWLNHPFSRKGNKLWIGKLIEQWTEDRIRLAACCITFASTSEEWFRPLMDFPQCFLWPRTNYLRPDGSTYRGVTKGSVVTYFGRDLQAFKDAFKNFGTVKV